MRSWQMSLVVAVAYFVTGYLGLMMPVYGSSITLMWLPTGIAVAALRRWGYGCWWGVALGAISVDFAIGNPFPIACGIAVGNTLGPLLATLILVRTGFSPELKRAQDILLLGGAAAIGMLVSATVGVFCLTVGGVIMDEYLRAWLFWWVGDTTGVIAAAPLLFVMNRGELRNMLMRRVELVLWVAVIIVVGLGLFVFNSGVQGGSPLMLAFLPLPLIVWGAMRFGPIGTSLAIILFSFCAVFGSATGHGLFARTEQLEGVVMLWLFMISCGILGWLVSALDAEKTWAVESARLLERALNEVSLGVLLADKDRRITHLNGGFTRLTGYSATEILGRSCRILQGPETDPGISEKIRSSLGQKGIFEGDILNYRKDGTTFWNALLISPIHDTYDELSGFIGIQRDVTQRKTAEAALRESEERLRIALTAAAAFAFVWDAASDSVVRYFSTEPSLPTNMDAPEPVAAVLARIHKDDRSRFMAVVSECLASGTEYRNSYRIVRPDGTNRWLEEYGTLSWDVVGRPLKLIGISIDVTERNQSKETMQRILDITAPTTGTEYFRTVLDFLSLNCGVEFAYAGRIDPKNRNRIQTIAVSQNGKSIDNFSFDLADTPCEHVIGRKLCCFPTGVAQLFPNDLLLVEMGIDGYLGIPLWSGSGKPLGLIVLLSKRPIPHPEQAEAILQVVAARGGAELERKLVDLALRESEERYRQMFESNPQPMWVYDLETLAFLAVNDAAIAKYGYSRDEFLALTIKDIRPSEDVAPLLDNLARVTSGLDDAGMWRHQLKNGQLIRVRITSHTMTFDGRPAEVVLALDITDQLKAEVALRESESRFRTLIEDLDVGVVLQDAEDRILLNNPAAAELLGLTQDQLTGATSKDPRSRLIREDGSDLPLEEVPSVLAVATQRPVRNAVVGATNPQTGMRTWIQVTATPQLRPDNSLIHVLVTLVDLTDRKRAEEALRASEIRYRTLFETSSDAIFLLGLEGHIASANPAAARMNGYTNEELLTMRMQDLDVPDSAAESLDWMRRLRNGEALTFEVAHHRKDGTTFPAEVLASAVELGGEWFVLAFCRDITDRKNALRRLEDAERRQRLALDAGRMGTWAWEIGSDRLNWDEREQALYGFEPGQFDELLVNFLARIHPEDLPGIHQILAQAANGHGFEGEFRIQLPSGEVRWIHGIGTVIPRSDSHPPRLVGINYDITQRKESEQALVEEKSLLQALFGSLPGIAFAFDETGRYLRWNQSFDTLLGWSDEDMGRLSALETVSLRDRDRIAPLIQEAFVRGESQVELNALGKDGREIPLYCTGVRVLLGGRPCVVGFGIDITERLLAERAVRESEERLRIFVENAPVGVAMLDRELRYISYSRRWLTDYGLGEQDLVGRSHYEVFPEVTDRWREIHRRCLTGVSEHCEKDRFDRVDGTSSYLRWEIQPWYNAAGKVGGLVFFTELITDRVKAEEQINASLREKESLLKEVHHRVKNNLQIITSLLNLQAETVKDPTTLKLLLESQNRVRSMALVHETLYQSGDFGRIDLAAYVDAICNFLSRAYGIDNSRIQIEVDVDDVSLDLDRAIPCGLIINELVSNALKYAFPENRNGGITVRLTSKTDQVHTLIVKDDGVGLPPDLDLGRLKSLGLQLVGDLVRQLSGSIVIEPAPGAGFFISFPTQFPEEQLS